MGCVTNENFMMEVMVGCDIVMHFAGLKAVGESTVKPLEYYRAEFEKLLFQSCSGENSINFTEFSKQMGEFFYFLALYNVFEDFLVCCNIFYVFFIVLNIVHKIQENTCIFFNLINT